MRIRRLRVRRAAGTKIKQNYRVVSLRFHRRIKQLFRGVVCFNPLVPVLQFPRRFVSSNKRGTAFDSYNCTCNSLIVSITGRLGSAAAFPTLSLVPSSEACAGGPHQFDFLPVSPFHADGRHLQPIPASRVKFGDGRSVGGGWQCCCFMLALPRVEQLRLPRP